MALPIKTMCTGGAYGKDQWNTAREAKIKIRK